VLHVDKTAHPWQLLDLTPVISGADPLTVSAFDVLEVGKSLHLAVSVKHKLPEDSAQEVHQIYWASLKQPRVEMGEDGKLQGFAPTGKRIGHLPTSRELTDSQIWIGSR
jgi:hypothetical protein